MLFVPATGGRKLDKAFSGPADGVIVDLEDAVATAEKAPTREAAATYLRTAMKDRRFRAIDRPEVVGDPRFRTNAGPVGACGLAALDARKP